MVEAVVPMSIERFYTETIKVVTVTEPDDFSTAVRSESCSTVSAAVNPASGRELFAGGRNEPYADYKAFMSSTVSIDEQNRVVWSGSTMNVVFVKDTLNMGHHKLVYLKKDVR